MFIKKIKAVSKILFTSILFNLLLLSQISMACFTGYNPEDYSIVGAGDDSPSLSFKKNQNKTIEEIKHGHFHARFYTKNTEHAQWQLLFMGFDTNFMETLEYKVAIYPLLNLAVKGYILMEEGIYTDPCENELFIQKEIEKQTEQVNALITQIPNGFDLKIYERRNGQYIYQTALFWYPTPIFDAHGLAFEKARLTMRAKYHRDLEFILKPYIQSYFTYNIHKWIEQYRQNLNS